jgi:TatA/E family protein of Tat protein translocase
MFGLSGEHLLILGVILLIFGPRKLPELGASIGKAMRNFKEGLNTPPTQGELQARQATRYEALSDETAKSENINSATKSDNKSSTTTKEINNA